MLNDLDINSLLSVIQKEIYAKEKVLSINELIYEKRNKNNKRFFKIKLKNKFIHLTSGYNLEKLYKRSNKIYELLPTISCKPLFIYNFNGIFLFGQEYFEGKSLSYLIKRNLLSEITFDKILSQIDELYLSIERNAEPSEMLLEMQWYLNKIAQFDELQISDRKFLKHLLFPVLKDMISHSKGIKKRWSQGDLTPENILLDKAGSFRIIDCEFAHNTHFTNEDWVRFSIFSSLNSSPFIKNKMSHFSPFDYFFHNLRQSILTYESDLDGNFKNTIKSDVTSLLENFFEIVHSETSSSLVFKTISKSVSTLKNEINSKSNQIYDLNKSLIKKNETISSKSKECNNYKEKVLKLENENNIKLEKLENDSNIKLDKILRMENSYSWRFTSLFRFFRRKFIDKKKLKLQENRKIVSYDWWIKKNKTLSKNQSLESRYSNLSYKPVFSILLPTYNSNIDLLERAIKSVINQSYPHWELCIADDGSEDTSVIKTIKKACSTYENVKFKQLYHNQHISSCSNAAASIATGDYITFLDHDDELSTESLLEFACTINSNSLSKFLYSDEDKIDHNGKRSAPFFKPGWSPDLLLSQNYICHQMVIKRELFNEAKGFNKNYDGSQDWDLALRITEKLNGNEIIHIPKVLYHWRITEGSTAKDANLKEYAKHTAKSLLEDYLFRNDEKGNVISLQNRYFHIKRCGKLPSVTILIPTHNGGEVLIGCVESIFKNTKYNGSLRVVVIDNRSSDPLTIDFLKNKKSNGQVFEVIKDSIPFNYSLINNRAVEIVNSEVLIFLNDDTQVISEDWIKELSLNAVREQIGAVGPKLLYPNKTIQHAGIVLGIGGVAGHIFKRQVEEYNGLMNRINITHNVSAVTGACLCVERSKFLDVNGFDSVNLKVAFNDVDFCLKLLDRGYYNLCMPNTKLFHIESYSRGDDNSKANSQRFVNELKFMQEKWANILNQDRFYNPNLSLINEEAQLCTPRV
tara:strand:- start:1219 stop:4140 length:2922 start_codon:yes stop_codon:yes gene_type:complete